jgi:hypothetical protein
MSAAPQYDRPDASEYNPYYGKYIALVPEGDLLRMLEEQNRETMNVLGALPETRGDFSYAPGKWTLKEVIGHLADSERVFSYRALRFARGDQTPLASFEQDDWVPQSGAAGRSLADLATEYAGVRRATLDLLTHLPPEAPVRRGTASGNVVSVRALAWIIAGHERHHLKIIREKYLS